MLLHPILWIVCFNMKLWLNFLWGRSHLGFGFGVGVFFLVACTVSWLLWNSTLYTSLSVPQSVFSPHVLPGGGLLPLLMHVALLSGGSCVDLRCVCRVACSPARRWQHWKCQDPFLTCTFWLRGDFRESVCRIRRVAQLCFIALLLLKNFLFMTWDFMYLYCYLLGGDWYSRQGKCLF